MLSVSCILGSTSSSQCCPFERKNTLLAYCLQRQHTELVFLAGSSRLKTRFKMILLES